MSDLPRGVRSVAELGDASAEQLVGGRVVSPSPPRIGDALRQVDIELAPGEHLTAHELVVVRARWDGQRLSQARVEWRQIGHAPAGGEVGVLRDAGVAAALATRDRVVASVREFFRERGYLEVETPTVVPSPGLDLHLDAFDLAQDIGGRAAYLSTSPEYQMKRLLCGGLPRIMQITRAYRRGEQGQRHNPEFTMLEWYRAWTSMHELIDETEALVRRVLERHGTAAAPASPFERVALLDAFERFAGLAPDETLRLSQEDEDAYFLALVEKVEPAIAALGRPVFVHHFPASQASLARLDPADPRLCERFELYLGEVELCNGFGELTDPSEQRRRFERDQQQRQAQGKPVYPLDERFLAALHEGMPPSAGNALGIDRLVACCLGGAALQQVQSYPTDRLF
jgi:lysyl-tRNA synthetase class 2